MGDAVAANTGGNAQMQLLNLVLGMLANDGQGGGLAALLQRFQAAGMGEVRGLGHAFEVMLANLRDNVAVVKRQWDLVVSDEAHENGSAKDGSITDAGYAIRALTMDDGFQLAHKVYGRAAEPCVACARPLRSRLIAQRTTVWCPSCQE
mgnify:CR=1 FL=1